MVRTGGFNISTRIFWTKTEKDYNILMKYLHSKGYKWGDETSLLEGSILFIYGENTVVYAEDNVVSISNLDYAKTFDSDIKIEQYLDKDTNINFY